VDFLLLKTQISSVDWRREPLYRSLYYTSTTG